MISEDFEIGEAVFFPPSSSESDEEADGENADLVETKLCL